MNKKIISSVLLLSVLGLSACNNDTAPVIDVRAEAMAPVDSFNSKEVREYSDEGDIEKPLNTVTSSDGLCTINVMPSYFDVTLDFESGSHYDVGKAYAEAIELADPDFQSIMEPYIYENIMRAYNGEPNYDALAERLNTLYDTLDQDYKDELAGFSTELSSGRTGFEPDGLFSYEEALLCHMIPDSLRPTACSALSLWGSKTATGDRMTLRCLDWGRGSKNQMGRYNSVVRMKNGDKSLTSIGMLGLLDIISGVNDDGVFVAILDAGSGGKIPYVYEGKKPYTFEIRKCLETMTDATSVGNHMVEMSGDFTWCHNLIISDKDNSYCAEDCTAETAAAGLGFSNLRDESTPLLKGLKWDNPDSLCIINSFISEGNLDQVTGEYSNTIRFNKYNNWVGAVDKFTVKDLKDMITQETVNQYEVYNVHNSGCAQIIIVDYATGAIQAAFTGESDVLDKPSFIYLGDYDFSN